MKNNVVLLISVICLVLCVVHALPLQSESSNSEVEYENSLDLLRRFTRQAVPANGNNKMCKYKKNAWSACDEQTKFRTRTFTLKRGDPSVCQSEKTIRKECKGKKEGGKKKNRDRENGNNQGKNRDRAERPRKKNNHNNN